MDSFQNTAVIHSNSLPEIWAISLEQDFKIWYSSGLLYMGAYGPLTDVKDLQKTVYVHYMDNGVPIRMPFAKEANPLILIAWQYENQFLRGM